MWAYRDRINTVTHNQSIGFTCQPLPWMVTGRTTLLVLPYSWRRSLLSEASSQGSAEANPTASGTIALGITPRSVSLNVLQPRFSIALPDSSDSFFLELSIGQPLLDEHIKAPLLDEHMQRGFPHREAEIGWPFCGNPWPCTLASL